MKFKRLLKGNEKLLDEIVLFFFSSVINAKRHQKIISMCSGNFMCSNDPKHDISLKLGALSVNDFLFYAGKTNKISVEPAVVEAVLDKFCESFLFSKDTILQTFGNKKYKINKELAAFFYEKDLLYNLLFGFSYIAEKYKKNVFKIVISNKDDSQNIGTGFSFKYMNNEGEKFAIIITNKHVTSFETGTLQVLNHENEIIKHGKITNSDTFDLSVIEVSPACCENTFHFYHETEILDEVITIGYPPIATTIDSYQVVHKGEVNAFVKDYWKNEYILFSAKTAPGNSGGPLINSMGMVAGIVARSLEHKNQANVPSEAYFAAISAQDIVHFINTEHLS